MKVLSMHSVLEVCYAFNNGVKVLLFKLLKGVVDWKVKRFYLPYALVHYVPDPPGLSCRSGENIRLQKKKRIVYVNCSQFIQ